MNSHIKSLLNHIASDQPTRILAFGSSNTERLCPGMHWFDCFEMALHQNHGPRAHCINVGVGGNTTRHLLARFESDAAFYKPHAAFLTIGGNDCKPEEELDATEFEANLNELWKRFDAIGTHVIFQTYYAVISDGSERFQKFYLYMDLIRKVARERDATLIDHLARWEPLRQQRPDLYKPLMGDAFHLIARGNKVVGLDIARTFGWQMRPEMEHWAEAFMIQQTMDQFS
ncbi:SGNH/GDSL hydrolase family protein [Coraliomargarita algicola]|uniref:SGNH/GDSL hydrolase family protein n=1 Tax=Coraliomargarita algicola TaxID=3092156 RepID=A0ABZ0RNN2_9BACT|nr:SGNH/GDSL hydrolase family protein [Coraliomargarita sp. J2-16]WPJ96733.1 SGNH/GDSL hydrolase family protein [Coraliomargarita sp. J2-16]